jgi:hypothetical protein
MTTKPRAPNPATAPTAARAPKKALPPDVAAGQVWRDADGQHYYVESAGGEKLATLQRCSPAGRVLNPRYRINRTADQLREGFVLVKDT